MTFGTQNDPADSSFTDGNVWINDWCVGGTGFGAADFNGDGKQDIWCQISSGGGTSAAVSNGAGTFTSWGSVPWPFGYCSLVGAADFNGDGLSDLWCGQMRYSYDPFSGQGIYGWVIYVSLSNGTGTFTTPSFWGPGVNGWCGSLEPNYQLGAADFNGDGKQDVWCSTIYYGNQMYTVVALSTGVNAFSPAGDWLISWCSDTFGTGDFNGDGKQDLSCHSSSTGTTSIALSTGASFTTPVAWLASWCTSSTKVGPGDFNGDG